MFVSLSLSHFLSLYTVRSEKAGYPPLSDRIGWDGMGWNHIDRDIDRQINISRNEPFIKISSLISFNRFRLFISGASGDDDDDDDDDGDRQCDLRGLG